MIPLAASIILKGHYKNVTPDGEFLVKAGSCWFAKADQRHYLEIPEGGAWTLLGFWTGPNQMMRPMRYFYKYGIPPCDMQ
jgi:mannose-6-phosphate isomerase-like protein (cupin superfamily)